MSLLIGAAYLRCSDPRQDKSIEQQRDEIQRQATADGVLIPPENWFIDEGLSGRSARKRKSYQDLLRRAELQRDALQGRSKQKIQRIDRLYVWAFSRIARNMFDCLRALATLDDADIDVVSLTERDTGDRSLRKLIRPILAWLAERYSEELSRNVQRGMRSQAERGYWVYGHAPYGYAALPTDGGTRLAVTEETRAAFEVVQRLFREYLEGKDGFKRLAERLTLEGVTPPTRDDRPRERLGHTWRSKHVDHILGNPVYAGHLVYDGEVVCRDAHTPAVSDADFSRAAALRALKERRRQDGETGHHPIRLGERGLLTPWLRCGTCGGRIHVTVGGRPGGEDYYYYVCATRTQNKAACPGLSVRVDRLDTAVQVYIETQLLTPEHVQALVTQALDDLSDQPDEAAAARAAIEAQIAELDRKIRLVGGQVLDGILAPEDARALNAPLLAQREAAKLRLATLPSATPLPDPDTLDPEAFRAAVREAWSARSIEARREALDRLIDQITLTEGGAHIDYRIKDADPAFRHQAPNGPARYHQSFHEHQAPTGCYGSEAITMVARPESRLRLTLSLADDADTFGDSELLVRVSAAGGTRTMEPVAVSTGEPGVFVIPLAGLITHGESQPLHLDVFEQDVFGDEHLLSVPWAPPFGPASYTSDGVTIAGEMIR